MNLLAEITHHLRRTGEAETRFGRRVANDPALLGSLRAGRQPRPAMAERIRAAIQRSDRA